MRHGDATCVQAHAAQGCRGCKPPGALHLAHKQRPSTLLWQGPQLEVIVGDVSRHHPHCARCNRVWRSMFCVLTAGLQYPFLQPARLGQVLGKGSQTAMLSSTPSALESASCDVKMDNLQAPAFAGRLSPRLSAMPSPWCCSELSAALWLRLLRS